MNTQAHSATAWKAAYERFIVENDRLREALRANDHQLSGFIDRNTNRAQEALDHKD